jgi:hypothetical protein
VIAQVTMPGLVFGRTMAPYWDPDCDCRASTVFEGSISGDRITGTFRTERASSDQRVVSGKWRVDRARS